MSRKIGFYGGTFDPVHFGHLNLAVELSEKHNLDEVWFCPARTNPHKMDRPPIDVKARLEMLSLAVKDMRGARILDLEADREGPSYTIDTVRDLLRLRQSSDVFFLLLGEDSLEGLPYWKDIQELAELTPFLIAARSPIPLEERKELTPLLLESIRRGITSTRVMEISSSEIRDRICQNKYCGHLVPKEVLDYIYQHSLYFHSNLPLE